MLDLIKYIIGHFAENPDDVDYEVTEKGSTVEVTVLLNESDMGKVIGRQGKIAKALRTIVNSASKKKGKRYNIEIKGKN